MTQPTLADYAITSDDLTSVADSPAGDGWVRRVGKIFELGTWPDKAFSLTAEEADAALTAFEPVPLELEHFETRGLHSIFDGKLGALAAVWRDGNDILGAVDVPAWVDSCWAEQGRKISAVWNIAAKTLTRAGLVLSPRISDAALYAAFAEFAGARHSTADRADMQRIHDITVGQGATCAPPAAYTAPAPPAPHKETRRMKFQEWFESLAGLFSEVPEGAPDTLPATPPAPAPAAFAAPAVPVAPPAKSAEVLALEARVATLTHEKYVERAAAFADAQITAGKLTPAERGTVIGLYTQALADDAAGAAVVTFGADGSQRGGRVDALLALFGGRPAAAILQPGMPVATLPAGETPADPAQAQADRTQKLLQMTELGQQILADKTSAK